MLRMVVMPNHFHCIIEIEETVGADLSVCPIDIEQDNVDDTNYANEEGRKRRCAPTTAIPLIIQWFKTMTTNEYIRGVKNLGWKPFNGKLWQRNYYEHIIRDERANENISNYIINNPAKWEEDKLK